MSESVKLTPLLLALKVLEDRPDEQGNPDKKERYRPGWATVMRHQAIGFFDSSAFCYRRPCIVTLGSIV